MNSIVAIDIETTGLDPQKDTIIEIAAMRFNGNRTSGNLKLSTNVAYTSASKNVAGGSQFQDRSVYWMLMNTPNGVPLTNYKKWKNKRRCFCSNMIVELVSETVSDGRLKHVTNRECDLNCSTEHRTVISTNQLHYCVCVCVCENINKQYYRLY